MERLLTQLVDRLQKTYQDRLVSVVLFGSAAVGDHHGSFSDINILCVLTQVTPRELADSPAIFHWWRGKGNPAPLLLSADEVHNSTDCFPIEFHDIRERHRVLYGENVVADMEVDKRYYRIQVEHDLRAKVLRLRQKAAGVLDKNDLLVQLLADSVSTFCVLFRHALLLHGEDASSEKSAIVDQAAAKFGIEPSPFRTLLDLREGKIKARGVEPIPLLGSYLKEIQVVVDAVDRLEK